MLDHASLKKNKMKNKMKEPPCSVSYCKVGQELKNLPGKLLNKIAYTKQLRVNGTRKQRDIFKEKDSIVFNKEFVSLSFSKKDVAYKSYVSIVSSDIRKVGIMTVKDMVKKVMQLKEFESLSYLKFSQKELDVLLGLGAEWLHYQLPLKG